MSVQQPQELLAALRVLRDDVVRLGDEIHCRWLNHIQRRAFRISAVNLAYYLALRTHDLRDLQPALSRYGISSLGRAEARVIPNIDAVIASLEAICGNPNLEQFPKESRIFRGTRMLRFNTDEVFGSTRSGAVRIMVTLPTEAAYDYELVRELVSRGMDCARINCAHDTEDEWQAMIAFTRRAAIEVGRPVKIHMDLGGPKVRTADIEMGKKRIRVGDTVLLTRGIPKPSGKFPNQIRCTLPEVLDQVGIGHSVWFDEGLVGAVIVGIEPEGAILRITYASDTGVRLKPEKGLNFPDTDLRITPLPDDDLRALDFVARFADLIGYSFVQDAEDIDLLQSELAKRREDWRKLVLIAKVETRRAVHNLPELIVRAASKQPFGVMIARGDLAVEVGYQRMAEIQEEILWLCEAAHIPVIWATQVLESFVKRGMPSRGEMTDAAMAARAECVMLNKGPHVGEAITILNDVLGRMQGHQLKKTPQLRALKAWEEVTGD